MGLANQARGAFGEQLVARWYEAQGYVVVDRNWRDGRRGELDLVLTKGERLLVVCEVKSRASVAYGHPLEAIDPAKLARIRRLGMAWITAHGRHGVELRVDAAAVIGTAVEVREAIG